MVFAQEVPTRGWLDLWCTAGYSVTLGEDRGWRIRSALITDHDLTISPLTSADQPNLHYHGNYLAAARWMVTPGMEVQLISVHASPSVADPKGYGWLGRPPKQRNGGGDPRWRPRTLWDSDLVLRTLITMSTQSAVIAAGDFNESRRDDFDEAGARIGTWGEEYYRRAARSGLLDISAPNGAETLTTRGRLQLDHVLASGAAINRVEPGSFRLDPWWQRRNPDTLSDHTALWFKVATT